MKVLLFSLIACIFISTMCSCFAGHNFRRDKPLFDSSPVITRYKAVADMNDAYFVIKQNHFFEFYHLLFDSVQNSRYAGRYTLKGDTLLLSFYRHRGEKLLGSKALINPVKKEIIFFNISTENRKLIFN